MIKKIAIFACIAASSFSYASFDIKKDKKYIETNALVKKYGKDKFVQLIVSQQNKMMAQNGGILAVNPYANIVQLIGMPVGLVVQHIQFDLIKAYKDSNKDDMSKFDYEKAIIKLKESLSPGGKLFNAQVNSICTTPNFRAQLDNGIVYNFKYYDTNYRHVATIEINNNLCENK